jgi:glycosyltransferase involved in cell wall biosynthesis
MTTRPTTLSAIVITRNEAQNLEDCLASLKGWVHEIVVVDSHSSDDTVAIAKRHGAKVSQPEGWPGFGPQKNRALALATCDWVLSIDADERVPPELAHEIQDVVLRNPEMTAYDIPRLSWYCGKFMRHGGWYPDHVLRLFKRGEASFSQDLVHEKVITQATVRTLQHPLKHFSFRTFSQVLDKVDRYSTASAEQLYARGKTSSLGKAVGHGLWAFIRTYVFKAAWRDGPHGFALAVSNAEGTYYRYLKLWLIQQERGPCQHPR